MHGHIQTLELDATRQTVVFVCCVTANSNFAASIAPCVVIGPAPWDVINLLPAFLSPPTFTLCVRTEDSDAASSGRIFVTLKLLVRVVLLRVLGRTTTLLDHPGKIASSQDATPARSLHFTTLCCFPGRIATLFVPPR